MKTLLKSAPMEGMMNNSALKACARGCLFVLVLFCQATTAQVLPPSLRNSVESSVMPPMLENKAAGQDLPRRAGTHPPLTLKLDAPASEKISAERNANGRPGTPYKIGMKRAIAEWSDFQAFTSKLKWQVLPSGAKVATVSVTSSGAQGSRLGARVKKIPESAILRFYSQQSSTAFNISGKEVLQILQRNLVAGDHSSNGQTYWGPLIEGDEVTFEIELPANTPENSVEISVPGISHLFSLPLAPKTGNTTKSSSASCEIDSACYSSWEPEENAIAKMDFVEDGDSYMCTGTLLNNTQNSYVPYFLSANHCISTQTTASTLETYWFYRASACGGSGLNTNAKKMSGGASLLYASATTDTSFMRLLGSPPAGAMFAGWTAAPAALSSSIVGIHHPKGDRQKISFGIVKAFESCKATTDEGFSCVSADQSSGDHLEVDWSKGLTEGGSSGSGLFITQGSSHYLVGQLHGGSSDCYGGTDDYGRFDIAYSKALKQWLKPAQTVTTPQSGWWWNAAESGSGYAIEFNSAGRLYMAAFVYASDGAPQWFVSTASSTATNTYSGSLMSFRSGQTFSGSYHAPGSSSNLGTVTLKFTDAQHGTITWPGGRTTSIQRFDIVTGGVANPGTSHIQTGWYWNADQSGRGFFLEEQQNTVFIAGFMYDDDGRSTWYVGTVPVNTTSAQITGSNWLLFGYGQPFGGTYKAPRVVDSNVAPAVAYYWDNGTQLSLRLPNGQYVGMKRFGF